MPQFNVPDDGVDVYPLTDPTVYEYVPFGAENVMLLVVDESFVPLKITDHDVPGGKPDSSNNTG